MKKLVCLTILLSSYLSGCASSDKAVNMLEERASYFSDVTEVGFGELKHRKNVRKKVFKIYAWRHESELPHGVTFLGGWLEVNIK